MSVRGVFYVAAHVADLARSKQFYSQKLGWTLETDEATVAGFRFGTGYLVLLADPAHPPSAPGGLHVAVQVDDIDGEYARLRDAGVDVSELSSQPWGERNFSFHDPDGYEWSFGEIRPRT
jgi:catechol 2,3-dioxygenase-like lactoylglutathione lyase family enzyme